MEKRSQAIRDRSVLGDHNICHCDHTVLAAKSKQLHQLIRAQCRHQEQPPQVKNLQASQPIAVNLPNCESCIRAEGVDITPVLASNHQYYRLAGRQFVSVNEMTTANTMFFQTGLRSELRAMPSTRNAATIAPTTFGAFGFSAAKNLAAAVSRAARPPVPPASSRETCLRRVDRAPERLSQTRPPCVLRKG